MIDKYTAYDKDGNPITSVLASSPWEAEDRLAEELSKRGRETQKAKWEEAGKDYKVKLS